MRRKARRAIINIIIFAAVLCIILYLTFDRGSQGTFAWSTIRYRTSSISLPPDHGICPGLAETEQPALVVSRVAADGDAEWLNALTGRYHLCVYNVDAPAVAAVIPQQLRVPANRGHEAMAYLTFIIDNYLDIPAAGSVFVHGSRWAWHNDAPDYDNKKLLRDLNVSAALEVLGYHNLRCDWSASTCGEPGSSEQQSPPQGSLETKVTAILEPWNKRAVSDAALSAALSTLFTSDESPAGGKISLGRSDSIRAQCCAQFVVSQTQIWQHSRDEYVALRQWLLDADSDAPRDDRISGRVLSYLWHILFLPKSDRGRAIDSQPGNIDLDELNNLACPSARDCYCRLYGRCNLKDCMPGHCEGQYSLPKDYRLPDDWESTRS